MPKGMVWIFDENRNWKPHSCNQKSRVQLQYCVEEKWFKITHHFTLYCTLVSPYLTYRAEIFGNNYWNSLRGVYILYILQKRATSIQSSRGTSNIYCFCTHGYFDSEIKCSDVQHIK